MFITNEKAFELIPHVMDIYEKIKPEIDKSLTPEHVKGKSQEEVGLIMQKQFFRNISKVKNEIFEIMAVIEDRTAEEIKKDDFIATSKKIINLLKDKELLDFFKSAMQ